MDHPRRQDVESGVAGVREQYGHQKVQAKAEKDLVLLICFKPGVPPRDSVDHVPRVRTRTRRNVNMISSLVKKVGGIHPEARSSNSDMREPVQMESARTPGKDEQQGRSCSEMSSPGITPAVR